MKLIYDAQFQDSGYAQDNAAMPGRMEAAMSGLLPGPWGVVAPVPATADQLRLAHDADYVQQVVGDPPRFAMATLAAGGAILAGRLAHGGDPAFACVRPPGHHASRMGAWGHCTFSNLALALLVLRAEGRIESAFIMDIDAHTGDGTRDVLALWPRAEVFNPFAATAAEYLELVEARLAAILQTDIIAVSAGFDAYKLDVGHKLDTPDFRHLGTLAREAALRLCHGRRFAVLEGGYYLRDLGANVLAFCQGFAP
jgi:acetoin utilization deacetylase AcuC-like enzyme